MLHLFISLSTKLNSLSVLSRSCQIWIGLKEEKTIKSNDEEEKIKDLIFSLPLLILREQCGSACFVLAFY